MSTLALALTLAVSALAAETKGTVKSVDAAAKTVVLEDGTQLSVSEGPIADLAPGDKIEAAFEVQGGKNIVTELHRMTIGNEGQSTTNLGSRVMPDAAQSMQSPD